MSRRSRLSLLILATLVAGIVGGVTLVSRAGGAQLVDTVYIATGDNYPDALVAGRAFEGDGPILLVGRDNIPQPTIDELVRLNPRRIVIIGGTAVVSSAVEAQLAAYTGGAVHRYSGGDRYETAAAVSEASYPAIGAASCAHYGFRPVGSGVTTWAVGGGSPASGAYALSGTLVCPLSLPDGSTIISFQMTGVDDSTSGTGAISCGLYRVDLTGGFFNIGHGSEDLLAVASTFAPDAPGLVEVVDTTIAEPTVTNAQYAYFARCDLDNGLTRVTGVIVRYQT